MAWLRRAFGRFGTATTLIAGLFLLLPATAATQAYPSKPVRMILPYLGGVIDHNLSFNQWFDNHNSVRVKRM